MNISLTPQDPSDSTPGHAADLPGVYYDPKAEILRFTESSGDPRIAAARMSLRGTEESDESREAMALVRAQLSADAADKLTTYRPDLPAEHVALIRTFVENAVAVALPLTKYSVEVLMRPCMAFVYWAVFVVGCPQDATVVFDRELIEHYIHSVRPRQGDKTELADGTLRNYRAWILRVAEAVNPEQNPRNPRPLNGRGMDEPYDDDDHFGLDRWAAGQNSPYMRQAARTLIALGAGAGLSASEITHLRRESVSIDAGVITIDVVSEKQPRQVTLLAKYEGSLAEDLADVPEHAFVFLPNRTRTKNDVVSAFVARSVTPPGSLTVRAQRLRNTWLVTHMRNRVDVYTLMQAAGLKSLESISRLAVFVPRPSTDARIAQLRGTK